MMFSPDVLGWEKGRSQGQKFNCKYFYFYIEVIIIYLLCVKRIMSALNDVLSLKL
jgi:hypothetical protein